MIAQVSGDNADLIPVTLTFTDVDGDGKVDLQVHVNGTTYTLFNDGTTFKIRNQRRGRAMDKQHIVEHIHRIEEEQQEQLLQTAAPEPTTTA